MLATSNPRAEVVPMQNLTVQNHSRYTSRHTREPCIEEVQKPWGRFIRYTLNEPTTVKILEVKPGTSLSLQSHCHRDELWVVLSGEVTAEIEGRKHRLGDLATLFIPRGTKHRLQAHRAPARILEISFGFFDEEDIVRYEDEYGRL
jgi:mannose-1-phosphate guanylyltransferase/mannose-6-phosphate isomerase